MNSNYSVLISGATVFGGYSSSIGAALSELKWKVSYFDDEKVIANCKLFYNNKYVYRLIWKFLAKEVQNKLIKEIYFIKPDILFVIKGFYYSPGFIKKIKSIKPSIKLLHFNPDNSFNTWHFGNSNKWIRSSIYLYDIHFTWGQFLIKKLSEYGAKKVYYLPFACDLKLHQPEEINKVNSEFYGSDIAFIGTWDEEREWLLNQLLEYDLKIWGDGWHKANKNIQKKWQKIHVSGTDFSKVCANSKINLNIIRKQNKPAHNMRTFEIPASKGFVISNRTNEINKIYIENEEIICFDSVNELHNKIKYYLEENELRNSISVNAYRKTILEHTYKDRAKIIDMAINKIIN